MAIIYDYRIQFLFAFFIMLIILLIYPVRAETAWNTPDFMPARESVGFGNNNWISHSYRNLIMNRLNILSSLKEDSDTFFPENMFMGMEIDVSSYAAGPIFGQDLENQPAQDFTGSIQSIAHPLVEISYSLSKRITLEFTGRFSRHKGRSSPLSGSSNSLYGYTLMVGPSFNMGRLSENTHMYTSLGLGYKFIDTDSYAMPGDCPSTLGTGLCFGLKTSSTDIRIGVNHFRSFTDYELYPYDYDSTLNPSMMFLSVIYNFDS